MTCVYHLNTMAHYSWLVRSFGSQLYECLFLINILTFHYLIFIGSRRVFALFLLILDDTLQLEVKRDLTSDRILLKKCIVCEHDHSFDLQGTDGDILSELGLALNITGLETQGFGCPVDGDQSKVFTDVEAARDAVLVDCFGP